MSFNPFIGGSGGSGAPVDAFTKEEVIQLLAKELDVLVYEADKSELNKKLESLEKTTEENKKKVEENQKQTEEVKENTESIVTENDLAELFGF